MAGESGAGGVNRYAAGESDRRPWGDWAVLDAGPGYTVKRIRVIPGGILSLQRHRHRGEHWTVVAGIARVTLNEETFEVRAGHSVTIGIGDIHRIQNPGSEEVVFIEVQHGAHLAEDDIERLEDVYGRKA
ncbi:MAG TPA: phosphomannose isomerase type II C-terminal cupin domain [Acetobacteraceae bacterium]|nr:phosphomannose isomerase type II C-terminal cupin domain [Acetobacteraceae bacterium]